MSRLILLAAVLFWAGASYATAVAAANAPAHTLDAADVNAWLDGFVPYALRAADIPGGVVVIVKDGQVLTERGFGYADIDARKPVDPQSTLFRPGSVSKLFTWTAVMQLVEAGKIDLDTDVNQYIDFRIPERDGKPITMRNLLTHTAGFEEGLKHLFAADTQSLIPLGAYLKIWTPRRIYPAGEQSAYSNYGAALAGYIVERVSGEPFNTYVARHIFEPLGMAHSTFDQPLPANLAPLMAKGYPVSSKQPKKFELVICAPAGSMSGTGADMAKFMMAHLMGGSNGGGQILRPETAQLMHKESFVLTPPLPGVALGFYHEDRNGRAIIGHAGDTELFHSDLHLFLDDHVGLFVSFNSAGKDGAVGALRSELFREFTDRYFPAPARAPRPTWRDARADGAKIVGTYILNRRSDSNFLRVLSGLQRAKVTMDDEGILTVSALKTAGGAVRRWREVGHLYWEEVNGAGRLAPRFVDGRYIGFASDNRPPVMLFQPAPFWANLTPLWLSAAYLAFFVLLWPIAAVIRKRYGQPSPFAGASARVYRLTRLGALADVLVLAGWAVLLVTMIGGDIAQQNDAINPWLRLLQVLGVVPIVAAGIGAWNLVVVWRDQSRRWPAKLNALLLLLALLGVVMEVFSLHLIGWSVDF
jgi:CubicO group peptidase (beta-lactamase class C family)